MPSAPIHQTITEYKGRSDDELSFLKGATLMVIQVGGLRAASRDKVLTPGGYRKTRMDQAGGKCVLQRARPDLLLLPISPRPVWGKERYRKA